MVTDYLKHLLPTKQYSANLTDSEAALVALVENGKKFFDDSAILDRLSQLKKSTERVEVRDYGAGSRLKQGEKRAVKAIARQASISPKFGQLYAKIMNCFNLNLAIELGTSLGIGTTYLAHIGAKVITIEGCPNIAAIAETTFKLQNLQCIHAKVGEFSAILPNIVSHLTDPALVYIDGNHQEKPTLDYYQFFKSHLPSNSVIVFDDIYWSKGMKRAWQQIKNDAFFSLDLYRVGIVVLEEKQHPLNLRMKL